MLTLLSGFAQEEPLPRLQSIDGVINELLDQITIEKGEQMDTAAVRKLFHPAAIFTVADSTQAETVSLNDFLNYLKDPYYEEGYLEQEIAKTVDICIYRRTRSNPTMGWGRILKSSFAAITAKQ